MNDHAVVWLVDVAVKGTVLLLIGSVIALTFRRHAAALKHLVWVSAFGLLLALPLLGALLPQWNVLPNWIKPTPSHVLANATTEFESSEEWPVISPATLPRETTTFGETLPADHDPAADASSESVETGMRPMSLVVPLVPRSVAIAAEYEHKTNQPSRPAAQTNRAMKPVSTLNDIIVVLWLVGATFAGLRLLRGIFLLWRLSRDSLCVSSGALVEEFDEIRDELGLGRRVRFLIGDERAMPMAWGVIRSCVLVPAGIEEWPKSQRRAVFLHELGHIARWDALWQLLVELTRAMHWFNPLVWIAVRRLQIERESACDDLVINHGVAPRDYARQLLDVVTGGRVRPMGFAVDVAMSSSLRIERRLRSIMDGATTRIPIARWHVLCGFMVCLSIGVPLAMIQGADEPTPANEIQPNAELDSQKSKNDAAPANVTQPTTTKEIRQLIQQLGDAAFNKRDKAQTRLIEIGVPAVELLRKACHNPDSEIAIRAVFALKAITDIPSEERKRLRAQAQIAFRAGDYDRMAKIYRRLSVAKNTPLDDVLWHGHAYQLAGRWTDARDVYKSALDTIDDQLRNLDKQIKAIDKPGYDPGEPVEELGKARSGPVHTKESRRRVFQRKQDEFKQQWPQLVLLVGHLELSQLKNPKAASETLARGLRFAPVAARPLDELLGDARTSPKGDKPDLKKQLWFKLMLPIATVRYRAMAFEQLGNVEAAVECWTRVHLCQLAYKVALAWVDAKHLLDILDKMPSDKVKPHHEFVAKHPGRYQDPQLRKVDWSSKVNARLPDKANSPFRRLSMDKFHFVHNGPNHASLAKLADGRLLIAYTAGDWQQSKIMLSTSREGEAWEAPWQFSHNGVFDTRSPSLVVDDDDVIWLLCWSKRLDLKRYSSTGYRLWLASSRDGRKWSRLKPIQSSAPNQYQNTCQITRDSAGRFWVFHQDEIGSGKTPDAITKLTRFKLATDSEIGRPNHVHATFDGHGRCHLVYNDAREKSIYYTRSENMRDWTRPSKLIQSKERERLEFPQLLVRNDKIVLVYEGPRGYFRRGTIGPDGPKLGKPIQITDNRLSLNGSRLLQDSDTVYLPAGRNYTPALLVAKIEALLTVEVAENSNEQLNQKLPK